MDGGWVWAFWNVVAQLANPSLFCQTCELLEDVCMSAIVENSWGGKHTKSMYGWGRGRERP